MKYLAATGAVVLGLAAGQPAMAQDFDNARIVTETVGDGLYVLIAQGEGVIAGNVLVSVGSSGVLLVDDQVPSGIAIRALAAIVMAMQDPIITTKACTVRSSTSSRSRSTRRRR
jgi:hypothetical protein